MMQQTNQNLPAPDETGAYQPQDSRMGSWVYGEPSQAQDAAAQTAVAGLNGTEPSAGMSSAAAQSERMKNPVSMADTHMPANAEEAYQASLRSLLDRNIGYFVAATFQIGQGQPVTWQGILHSVGTDYVVLYQPDYERYISGDLYSLKFVQFHNIKGVPYCAASQNWQGHSSF